MLKQRIDINNHLPWLKKVDGNPVSVGIIYITVDYTFHKNIISVQSIAFLQQKSSLPALYLLMFVRNRLMILTGKVFVLIRSEEHTSELQSRPHLVCRLLLEKKKKKKKNRRKYRK